MDKEAATEIYITSFYGAMTRQGLVQVRMGETEVAMSPTKAREISGWLTEAAEAAETDELFMRFFGDRLGLQEAEAARILLDFRRLREEFRERSKQTEV